MASRIIAALLSGDRSHPLEIFRDGIAAVPRGRV